MAAASVLPRSVLRALAAPPACGSLTDIEHIVISIQENRSYDHYFGTYRGGRGFADTSVRQPDLSSIFAQRGYSPGPGGRLLPFRLDTTSTNAECTSDVDHTWATQHLVLNGGANDNWLPAHIKSDGPAVGPSVMGYYTRDDLPFYYALADAFSLCDNYHCSVIGPTDPNHLYNFSAWLDPAGAAGGPLVSTDLKVGQHQFQFGWTTMPEQLEARGISWKLYTDVDSNAINNVLYDFKAYQSPVLASKAFGPQWPQDFIADCQAGTLPQVSWIISPAINDEHPAMPVSYGEVFTSQVLSALTSNPAVWAKTVYIQTWDENGGFFDHVSPPTAPPGTPGEYLTVNPLPAAAGGIAGPIGLGFRVPCLVVSPFSRGGFMCSDVLDHTSALLFIERRFGVEVPNISAWRRATVGDMTTALNLVAPDSSVPALPATTLADQRVVQECDVNTGTVYPVPSSIPFPRQEPGVARRPSGLVCAAQSGGGAAAGAAATTRVTAAQVAALPDTAASALPGVAGAAAAGALLAGRWWARRRRLVGAEDESASGETD